MDDLSEINSKIDQYTGRANNFKRRLIWDDDPDVADSIRITSIVTGLRFIDVIRPQDAGNYIPIRKDFTYDPSEVVGAEGICLSEEPGFRKVDTSGSNVPCFRFDTDRKPSLALSPEESRSELKGVPAIRRARSLSHEE